MMSQGPNFTKYIAKQLKQLLLFCIRFVCDVHDFNSTVYSFKLRGQV